MAESLLNDKELIKTSTILLKILIARRNNDVDELDGELARRLLGKLSHHLDFAADHLCFVRIRKDVFEVFDGADTSVVYIGCCIDLAE